MKRIINAFFLICLVLPLIAITHAQDATATPYLQLIEPTPTTDPNDRSWDLFPLNLHCEQINGVSKGPTWGEITIGVSTVDDLIKYVATLNDYNNWQIENTVYFDKKNIQMSQDGIPAIIDACIDPASKIVTALGTSINRQWFVQDIVAQYGAPDVVTWGFGFRNRTAMWFEEGIAALAYIFDEHKELSFGQIDFVVYFPYQPKAGFEARWPYNKTSPDNPVHGSSYEGAASKEQNPFDFQAMIATITAEPSRTPTPTFVPYTPAPTAMP